MYIKTYEEKLKEAEDLRKRKEREEKEKYNIPNPLKDSTINPMELDENTFHRYCRMYLAEKIYNKVIETIPFNYSEFRNDIDLYITDKILDNMITESGRVITMNEIQAVIFNYNITCIDMNFISELVNHISKYDRRQYVEG